MKLSHYPSKFDPGTIQFTVESKILTKYDVRKIPQEKISLNTQ